LNLGDLGYLKTYAKNMGLFTSANNNYGISKVALRHYANFELPNSHAVLMPNFYWLRKNKESQNFIDSRIEEMTRNKENLSVIVDQIKPLPLLVIQKIGANSEDRDLLGQFLSACTYGGLLATIESESGVMKPNVVHPAIHSAISMFNLHGDGKFDPNISQGINTSVHAGYARVRFPEIELGQLLLNIQKIV